MLLVGIDQEAGWTLNHAPPQPKHLEAMQYNITVSIPAWTQGIK